MLKFLNCLLSAVILIFLFILSYSLVAVFFIVLSIVALAFAIYVIFSIVVKKQSNDWPIDRDQF